MTKVLIVEDDDILQRMYQKVLTAAGYVVSVVSDGSGALTFLQTEKPDVILLDIMLPGGMNGFDVLEQLKKDPKTREIKVLILTNLSTEEKVAKEIGASGYLVKSNTKPNQVVIAVKKLLE